MRLKHAGCMDGNVDVKRGELFGHLVGVSDTAVIHVSGMGVFGANSRSRLWLTSAKGVVGRV